MSNLLIRRHLMELHNRGVVIDPETIIAYNLSNSDIYKTRNYYIFLDLCQEDTHNALWNGRTGNTYLYHKKYLCIPNTKTDIIDNINSRRFYQTSNPINPRNFSVSIKVRFKDSGSNNPNFVAFNNSLGVATNGGFAVAGKVIQGKIYPAFFNFKGKSNKLIATLQSSVSIPISTTEYSEPHIITIGVRPYDETNIEMFINVDGVEDSVIKNVSGIDLMDFIESTYLGTAIGYSYYGDIYTNSDAVYYWIKVNSYNI